MPSTAGDPGDRNPALRRTPTACSTARPCSSPRPPARASVRRSRKRCLEEGARVVISDKHERRLAETAEQLGVTGIPCDVTDEADRAGACSRPRPTSSARIDVLVNNAGLGGTAELHEMTDDQWSRVLDVTLNGTFRCTRAALNHMYANGDAA